MDDPRAEIIQRRLDACRDTVRKLRAEVEVARSCEEDAKCMTATIYAELERLRDERRWIPVEERLPELDVPVFATDGRYTWIGCLSYCDDENGSCWCNTYGDVTVNSRGVWQCDVAEWDDDYRPTHWHPFPQPLPEPPKEK